MEASFPPKTPSSVAPGMEMVVEAGTEYKIEDDKGEAVVIIPRDNPKLIEFLHAFDHWLMVDKSMPEDATSIRDSAWNAVIEKFESLPGYLMEALPSIRAGGIALPGGGVHDVQ